MHYDEPRLTKRRLVPNETGNSNARKTKKRPEGVPKTLGPSTPSDSSADHQSAVPHPPRCRHRRSPYPPPPQATRAPPGAETCEQRGRSALDIRKPCAARQHPPP